MVYIETPRLLLREWSEKDIETQIKINSDPLVMEYFLKPLTEEETYEQYSMIRKEFSEYGYGLYAVERKEDRAFLGFTGFHNITFDVDFAPGVEIGWRLRSDVWNKGYATEAALACLGYAAKELSFDEVFSFTSLENKRSERIMQKIGMQKVKNFAHPKVPDGHPLKCHILYKINLSRPL